MNKSNFIFSLMSLVGSCFLLSQSVFAGKDNPNGFEKRCGWISNPTPANWWLTDKQGEWTISVQGGYQAEGDFPEFPEQKQFWVKTNGSHGYGCGCLVVKVNHQTKEILEIQSGKVLPIKQCTNDTNLKKAE